MEAQRVSELINTAYTKCLEVGNKNQYECISDMLMTKLYDDMNNAIYDINTELRLVLIRLVPVLKFNTKNELIIKLTVLPYKEGDEL